MPQNKNIRKEDTKRDRGEKERERQKDIQTDR